jgi:hypothetical protein
MDQGCNSPRLRREGEPGRRLQAHRPEQRTACERDWRDRGAYASLAALDRSGFAWEWLRRQPDFRDAALRAIARRGAGFPGEEDEGALRWHLHAFEDPMLAAPAARPVWTAARSAWVVDAYAERAGTPEDCLDLGSLAQFATLISGTERQRLLLSDGYRSIRLDVEGASLAAGPVGVEFRLRGVRRLDRALMVLRRLRSVTERRRFLLSLYPPVQRANRLIALLRTHDAREAGASQADIAEVLLCSRFQRSRWRTNWPTVRSQVQRLVRSARRMADGAFWKLLE